MVIRYEIENDEMWAIMEHDGERSRVLIRDTNGMKF